MSTYPATLPDFVVTGFSLTPVENVARTDMDAGNKRSRRRFVSVPDELSVKWHFTDSEFVEFRTWYKNETTGAASGALWFDISIPVGGGGYETKSARFKEQWNAVIFTGNDWQVSAKLEVE